MVALSTFRFSSFRLASYVTNDVQKRRVIYLNVFSTKASDDRQGNNGRGAPTPTSQLLQEVPSFCNISHDQGEYER